jgi:hypothetical protein
MKRFIAFASLLVASFIMLNCNKQKSENETVLYGMWTKGTNAGDTLLFYKRNERNILSYNVSFNPGLPAPVEVNFWFTNGKLSTRSSGSRGGASPIESFTWKQQGQEFEIKGIELFPFMSSTQVYFTYHKIR